MQRGSKVHEDLANYISGKTDVFPREVVDKRLWQEVTDLREAGAWVEQQWAFTKDWVPTEWFGYDAWVRMVVDAMYMTEDGELHIIDWKTGRIRDHHEDQVSLYTIGGFAMFDTVDKIRVRLLYTDSGDEKPDDALVYARDDEDHRAMLKFWQNRVKPMMTDKLFPARPGNYCRWCHYRANNNGPCEY